jgi:hypothetical protein
MWVAIGIEQRETTQEKKIRIKNRDERPVGSYPSNSQQETLWKSFCLTTVTQESKKKKKKKKYTPWSLRMFFFFVCLQ